MIIFVTEGQSGVPMNSRAHYHIPGSRSLAQGNYDSSSRERGHSNAFLSSRISDQSFFNPSMHINLPMTCIQPLGVFSMDDDLCTQYSQRLYPLLAKTISNCFAPSDTLGVLFSGGLDSSIITAILSKTYTGPIQLFVAGIEFAKDLDLAHEAAEALNLPLTLRIFNEEDVKEALPAITSLLGTPNVMNTELAIPFFFAAQCAKQFGITILICGQGADELFGGYAKYEKILGQSTPKAVLAQMESDLSNLQNTILPFLQRIVSDFGLHLVAPFLESPIIDFSSTLHFSCKLQRSAGIVIRKRVLRLLAENLGLPSQLVNTPKRAMQYGSGAHRVLTKLATEYWLSQNPELTQRQASTHTRVEQYLKQLAARTSNSH